MPRKPRKTETPKQVSLRLPGDLWARAERLYAIMQDSDSYQGITLSPSRVLIVAIARGLSVLEREHDFTPKRRK